MRGKEYPIVTQQRGLAKELKRIAYLYPDKKKEIKNK